MDETLVGEEQQIGVGGGVDQVLDDVGLLDLGGLDPAPPRPCVL